jgi:hypothetical protein
MRLIAIVLGVALGAFGAVYQIGLLAPTPEGRPGMKLAGDEASDPVSDWSFSSSDDLVEIETRAPWLLAHSVTVVCAAVGGALYVPSVYLAGGGFPDARLWNRNIVRDPNVRIRIADALYPLRASLVTDEAERASAFAAFAQKYPRWAEWHAQTPSERPNIAFVRLDPR